MIFFVVLAQSMAIRAAGGNEFSLPACVVYGLTFMAWSSE